MADGDLGGLGGRTFAAVLFDFDGTLVDSTPSVTRSWTTWTAEYGVSDLAVSHGVPVIEKINSLIEPERRAEALARIRALELADTDGIVPLPGAREALEALDDATCAIVTSCDRDLFDLRAEVVGFRVPAVTVTRTDVDHGKPDPEPWLRACELLGVEPADCLVVEDSVAGLVSGREAGCATLGLLTTTRRDEVEADAVVADLGAVRFGVVDGRAVLRGSDHQAIEPSDVGR